MSDGIYIEIDLIKFSSTGDEVFKRINIKNNESFYFDEILSFVVIQNTKSLNPKFYVTPYCLIYEYSLAYNKLVIPRCIKTNNFFYHSYYGNSYEVITKSEDIHTLNKVPPIETFKELGKNFDLNKIYNLAVTSNEYLNIDKTKYFIENNSKRISLNFITNFIKTQAILNSFSPQVKSVKYDRKNNNYLSIDIGRGGDMQRYFYINANSVTGTDPSELSLDECRSRYNKHVKKSKSSLFRLYLFKTYFNDKDYIFTVNSSGIGKYIGIDWNMAIHYSWKKNKKNEIVKKIRELLHDNGKIVITTIDGEKVKDEMKKRSTEELNFMIDDVNIKIVLSQDYEGNSIFKVYIPTMTSESQDEYAIDINEMIDVFESNKFVLLDCYHFDLITSYQDIFDTLTVVRNEREDSRHYFFKNLSNSNIKKCSDLEVLCSMYVSLIFEKI